MTRSPDKNLEPWARLQLGVETDASPQEVRSAFLRRVGQGGFVPNSSIPYAFAMLQGTSRTSDLGHANAQADLEKNLRGDIEAFARQYFQFDIPARKQRYQELLERCAGLPLYQARLGCLAGGVDLHLPPEDDANPVVELARAIGQWYVLKPGERARRRRAIIDSVRRRAPKLHKAAQQLQARLPAWSQLGAELLKEIQGTPAAPDRLYDTTPYRATAQAAEADIPDISLPAGTEPTQPRPAQGGGGAVWVWVVVLVILGRILVALLK